MIRWLAASFLLFPSSAIASPVTISGEVRSADGGAPLAGVTVEINGASTQTDATGAYSLAIPDADHYRLRFDAPHLFGSLHVFGASELSGSDSLTIPDVELVERRPGRQMLIFGGDVMAGRRYEEPLWGERVLLRPGSRVEDSRALLAEVAPWLRAADLAAVNLEIVLAEAAPGDASPKSIVFHADPALAGALAWAGVDYVSLGNNHAYDYLDPGIVTTRAALERAELGWSGAGLNEAEAVAPWRAEIGGTPYSFLGFVGWKGDAEPHQAAEGDKGGAALGTEETIAAAVEAEQGRVAVVQYHGSSEYSAAPSEATRRKMTAAIDAGADLAIGHHPHVLQGFSLYDGKLIAWSLGNLLFDQYFYETHASALLKVWMDGETFHRAEIVPLHIRDYRPVPAIGAMRQSVLRRLAAQSAPNGVAIGLSGGHGVIVPATANEPAEPARLEVNGDSIVALPARLGEPLDRPVATTDADGQPLRFGSDLFWRGDFEAFDSFGAADRSWRATGARIGVDGDAFAGRRALRLAPVGDGPAILEQKIFLRSFDRTALTLVGMAKADAASGLRAEVQFRPRRTDRMKALENEPWHPLGRIALPGDGWQRFAFEIPVPAADQTEFRIRLIADGGLRLDEIAIVNWEGGDPAAAEVPWTRTHVRLDAARTPVSEARRSPR